MTDINIFCEMLAAAVTAMMMIFLMAENTHKDAECKYLLCTMLSLFIAKFKRLVGSTYLCTVF
jgi:hypothetical protein